MNWTVPMTSQPRWYVLSIHELRTGEQRVELVRAYDVRDAEQMHRPARDLDGKPATVVLRVDALDPERWETHAALVPLTLGAMR